MEYFVKLPVILGILAGIAAGIASIALGCEPKKVYLRIGTYMVIFYILGLFARALLSGIVKEMEESRERKGQEEPLNEKDKNSLESNDEDGIKGEAALSAGKERNQTEDNEFRPLSSQLMAGSEYTKE